MPDQTPPSPMSMPRKLRPVFISDGWTVSIHAHSRLREFDLKPGDVDEIIARFEQSYQDRDGYAVRQRGQWAVVLNVPQKVVITVLRRTYKQWSHRAGL